MAACALAGRGAEPGSPAPFGQWWREPAGYARARPLRTGPRAPSNAARWYTGCCNPCPISPPSGGRDAALNYLARNASGWSEADRSLLADSVLGLIGDQRFAAVFAVGGRAEVAIVGRVHSRTADSAGIRADRPAGRDGRRRC